MLKALRYHLRDPVPLQSVGHPGNVLRVACVSISVSCDCSTLGVLVGATPPLGSEPSPGEERPDWIDENTCEVDPLEGLESPLDAIGMWCYYCGAPFEQLIF